MMNRPPIDELVEKTGCRYLLVSAAAKRARQIMFDMKGIYADNQALVEAVDEIYYDQLSIAHDVPTLAGLPSLEKQDKKA